jgi:hypothetical protein
VRKEVSRNLGVVSVVETHRPADRVQLVVSARTDRIGAVFDEQPDDGEIAALSGKVNRERVVSLIPDVRVGAAIEQRFHNRFVGDAEMQRRPKPGVGRQRSALVDEVRMLVNDRDNARLVALAGRVEQRDQRCL